MSMNNPSNRPAAIGLRLYRALANAFPQEFRNAYGLELLRVTEDAIEPIWRCYGVLGLARLLLDIAIRVPAEHLAELRQDIAYGLRMLRASPGFTAVALISLSMGICVATSAFSELNGIILRDLPAVPRPGDLVALQTPVSYPGFERYRQRSGLFSSTLAYLAPVPFGVSIGGHTERTWGHLVTPSYFGTLGVRPALGRDFDETTGAPPTVIVSYRFWQNHLGSDPSVIGKTLPVNGHSCTVIGVGPRDFLGASPLVFYADLWLPVTMEAGVAPELADNAMERRDLKMFQVVGRLKPGVTVARAEAELDAVTRQLEQDYGDPGRKQQGRRVLLAPGGKVWPVRSQDIPLFTAFPMVLVSLVLLIACSNIANMMLARAARRRREIAVRLALGASRARLVRQLLTEAMLVASGAGVLGFLMSMWLMHRASQVRPPLPIPVSYNLEPDARVLLFALAVTVLTGLAFGLAPALRATRTDLTPALKESGIMRFRGYRRLGLRNMLVLCQVAGSLMLLLLTGFLVLGFQRTSGIEVGFDPRNLYLISLDPIRDGYSGVQTADFFQKLLDRVKLLPSVTAASLTDTVPMRSNGAPAVTFSDAVADAVGSRAVHSAHRHVVGRDYFDTLGLPILLGRGFRIADESAFADNGASAVVVSEGLVRQLWQGADPLGRRIEIGNGQVAPGRGLDSLGTFDRRPVSSANGRHVFEVVGVVRDAKMILTMARAPNPAIYFPLRTTDYGRPSLLGVTLMVRSVPGVDIGSALRRQISAMDASLTPFNARSMPEQIDQLMYMVRLAVWIYGSIGIFGLILASVGLAGVTAYSVTQRSREIGIRIALGAQSKDVLGLVMNEGMVLVGVGAIIGLAGAWGAARLLSTMVSAVATATSASTSDPILLVGAPLLLASLAMVACYVPARGSIHIDPVVALRQE